MARDAGCSGIEDDPLWYMDAVIYQLHVRAFQDSDADGIGDFAGLTRRLDYLQDLGVTAIWLLPFYPSPLRDDGYDIADYFAVNPAYGTMRDFKTLLREAHRRGLRVITEVVMNHTSDQHQWFRRARRAEAGSRAREFYVWSDTPEKYRDARIIFKDFEPSNWSWDPVARAYYWHRFYSHQPDLNFDNPEVRKMMLRVVDFWLELGVDGLRLDAVPYLYEREGTTGENLPETHAFLKELRRHVDSRFRSRMLLSEANQWPEDAAAYFGQGDECNMAFHFPVMPRLYMALHMEDRYPIVEIMERTPPIPENAQWAIFLRNHDELTLEMVTDEDRDYMYRVYARDPQARINLGIRRRLAPLLGNHRRRIELMNGLLFSLPGTPVVYYGDEIGMGDNIYLGDRNGVRTPMQWSADRNAGFSRANPQRLFLPIIADPEYHYEAINVETQRANPYSLYWWMRRLVSLRRRYRAFSRGDIAFLRPDNRKVLAFLRRDDTETILVVANLSRFAQAVELDLGEFQGMVPVEMFGRTEFPAIGDRPYFLTLGPHSFLWFSLETTLAAKLAADRGHAEGEVPAIAVESWERFPTPVLRARIAAVLPAYLRSCRWFGGKARTITTIAFEDVISVPDGSRHIALVRVDYAQGDPETYTLPLALASGEEAWQLLAEHGHAVIARLVGGGRECLLFDGAWDRGFARALLDFIGRRRRVRGERGELVSAAMRGFASLARSSLALEPSVLSAEQSNTSIRYSDEFILKLFRRLEPGPNPELELARFFAERTSFRNVAPFAGAIEYRRREGQPASLAVLHGFVPSEGDAWGLTLDAVGRFLEAAALIPPEEIIPPPQRLPPLAAVTVMPVAASELIGPFLELARLLGQRTAEMHLALASDTEDPQFAPEPMTGFYRQSLYHGMLSAADQSLRQLREQQARLPGAARAEAAAVIDLAPAVIDGFRALREITAAGMRIRCHGDYHLGQVLFTGQDFMIIDFEGEPARPAGERRIKRSPLRDVAGMLRSFDYAASAPVLGVVPGVAGPPVDPVDAWRRADFWCYWVSAAFLGAYLSVAGRSSLLPGTAEGLERLLRVYVLEKALYELRYELSQRPDWVQIPLHGIVRLLARSD